MRTYLKIVVTTILVFSVIAPVWISAPASDFRDGLRAPVGGQPTVLERPIDLVYEDLEEIDTRNVIVLFFEFPDREKISESKIDRIMTKTLPHVSNYFEEASYGSVNIESSFESPKNAGRISSYYEGDLRGMANDAVEAYDDRVDFSQYDHVLVLNNGDWSRATASLGQARIESGGRDLWIGLIQAPTSLWEPRVFPPPEAIISHELYHNIGGLPDLYVPPHKVGPWDPMAEGGRVHTISYFKTSEWLGWLPENNLEILTPGTFENYTVYPLESRIESDIQVLKIPTREDHYYFVEVRKNTPISDGLPEEGVLITRVEEMDDKKVLRLDSQRREVPEVVARVMDARPRTDTLEDAVHRVDDELRVEEDNLQIEILSREENSYKLRTTFATDTPLLTIRSPIPHLSVIVDNESYEMDENGVLSKNVWPGTRVIRVPSKVKIDEQNTWVFRGWEDREYDNERSVDVLSDLELKAEYEIWKRVEVLFTDGFGSPLRNESLSVNFDNGSFSIRTDADGKGTLMVPHGEQRITLSYFGQERILELGEDDYEASLEIPYTPFITFISGILVAVFLLLLYLGVRSFAGYSGTESL